LIFLASCGIITEIHLIHKNNKANIEKERKKQREYFGEVSILKAISNTISLHLSLRFPPMKSNSLVKSASLGEDFE